MNTLVAGLAIGCFIYAVLYLLLFNKPEQLYLSLRKIKKELENIATDEEDSSEYLSKTLGNVLGVLLKSCLVVVLGALATIAEIIIITYALTNKLGFLPVGYLALGMVLINIAWTIFGSKRLKKNQELADLKNEDYLPKRNWFHVGLNFLVDVYCLYIFLILINLI